MSLRFRLAIVAPVLAAACLFTSPALARDAADPEMVLAEASAALSPGRYVWNETGSGDPVSVLISIPDQRAYVFRGQTLVAASTVSTGKGSKPTPTGVFTILQKEAVHHSNLYNAAPMPYMQRLTWDGVAMHAGTNPGFPASHGCIRMPTAFAKKLYGATSLGATVEVTDEAYITANDGKRDTALAQAPRSDAQATAAANRGATRDLDRFLASK